MAERRPHRTLIVIALLVALMGLGVAGAASAVPAGGGTVYVATGENFPDALGAGAAGGVNGGPVLLVQQNSIPTATLNELNRLAPRKIVIVGGTAVVSTSVADQLAALPFAPGVVRYGGANRYETAALLSQNTFPRTGGASCSLTSFFPGESTDDYSVLSGARTSLSGTRVFYCDVTLPDGVTVTKLTASLDDNDAATDSACFLVRVDLTGKGDPTDVGELHTMAFTPSTTGSSGIQVLSTTTIDEPMVFATRYGHMIVCTATPDLGIVGAVVEYELTG